MALILEPDRVRLYNILSKSWEPESLAVETAGKQWLCTPCRTALLAVHHDAGLNSWMVDAYALEDGGTAQPLFWGILENELLPREVASLPHEVRWKVSLSRVILSVDTTTTCTWFSSGIDSDILASWGPQVSIL